MEYVIINKETLEKRIKELINENPMGIRTPSVRELNSILNNSIPLIPEIEKAYIAGENSRFSRVGEAVLQAQYISNLKLSI